MFEIEENIDIFMDEDEEICQIEYLLSSTKSWLLEEKLAASNPCLIGSYDPSSKNETIKIEALSDDEVKVANSITTYPCQFCQISFCGQQKLSHHLIYCKKKPQSLRYKGSTHECDACNAKFSTNSLLQRHKMIHSGERPFQCKQCNQKFKRMSHLKDHKTIHSAYSQMALPRKKWNRTITAEGVKIIQENDVNNDKNIEMFDEKLLADVDNINKSGSFLSSTVVNINVKSENEAELDMEGENVERHYECVNVERIDIKPRKRKRKKDPDNWKQNIAKQNRALGQEYLGKKIDNKTGKWITVLRPKRKRKELCSREACKGSKKRHCEKFTEEDCDAIFEEFWSCGDKRKQDTFIHTLVDVSQKSTATVAEESRRENTRSFHLKKNGTALQVCKNMFLSTVGISGHKVSNVLATNKNVEITKEIAKRRNPAPSKDFQWNSLDQMFLEEFFEQIPKAPGHYCPKDIPKIYLSKIIPSMSKLFEIYKDRCAAFNKIPLSIFKFTEYFKDKNYSLFKQKKDMCNTCTAYEEGNLDKGVFSEHQWLKIRGYDLKEHDKVSADNHSKFVITADTESVLFAPLNKENIMFFRSKLNLHTFTFFDLKTNEVENYLWSEVNGDLHSSNITTCYIDFLTNLIVKNPALLTIVLWSDGCTYQNRCNVLSSALMSFAARHNITIYHKYLEVGHTHIECESVHTNIEKAAKHFEVNMPSDYVNIIQNARKKKPGRYGVKYLDYTFFKNYMHISDIKSIKPTKEVGSPYVVDIRQLCYKPEGTIFFNLTYDENEWKELPHTISLRHLPPPPLYVSPIKIAYTKWCHLQEIKSTIPKECHSFYDNLNHYSNRSVKNESDTI